MVIRSFLRRTDEALPRDTRKPTLNPKPGVSLLFSTNRPHPPHILPDPFISFPQEYDEKGREPSPPNSKIFHVRPGVLPSPKTRAHILYRGSTQRGI